MGAGIFSHSVNVIFPFVISAVDVIAYAVCRFRKQYKITSIVDYRCSDIEPYIEKAETVFIYDIPAERRLMIMRLCYKHKVNVYFNPYLEDIMEVNAKHYVLDDVYLFNKNNKTLTMEQRILKRLLDIGLSLLLGILTSPLWTAAQLRSSCMTAVLFFSNRKEQRFMAGYLM